MKNRTRLIFFGVVALQLLFLLGLVAYKETTLRFGHQVVLQTAPVDPRDLFRGDYVALRYEISTLERQQVWFPYGLVPGDKLYVRLQPQTSPEGERVWTATAASRRVESEWDVFLKGRVVDVYQTQVRLEYGIESYFVPEGQGRDIERARDVKVSVAVDGFGKGIIKGLIVGGVPWEPQ